MIFGLPQFTPVIPQSTPNYPPIYPQLTPKFPPIPPIPGEGQALLSHLPSLSALAQAEAQIRAAIACPEKKNFSSSLPWLASALGPPPNSNSNLNLNFGDGLWNLVLREPISNFWPKIFEKAFELRAISIIEKSYRNVLEISQKFEEALGETKGGELGGKGGEKRGYGLWELPPDGEKWGKFGASGAYLLNPVVSFSPLFRPFFPPIFRLFFTFILGF